MRRALYAALIALTLLSFPVSGEEALHGTAELEELETWQDPSGGPVRFTVSFDASTIVTFGGPDPGRVRMLDRNLTVVGELTVPFDVVGARLSMTGKFLLAWGHEELALYDVPSLEPNITVLPDLPLRTFDAARFYSYDDMLVVCGRDVNGTSRVVIVEVRPRTVFKDHVYPGNATVLMLENEKIDVNVLDDSGAFVRYSTVNWSLKDVRRSHLSTFTAASITQETPQILGDAEGDVTVWSFSYTGPEANLTLPRGPVQGVAWIVNEFNPFLVAFPREGGGSTIQVWRLHGTDWEKAEVEMPLLIAEVNVTKEVTMMATLLPPHQSILVGYSDGTLRTFHVNMTYPDHAPPNGNGPVDPNGEDGDEEDDDEWGSGGYALIGALFLAVLLLTIFYFWLRRGTSDAE